MNLLFGGQDGGRGSYECFVLLYTFSRFIQQIFTSRQLFSHYVPQR